MACGVAQTDNGHGNPTAGPVGVASDNWVMCTGYGQCDMLGEQETQMYAWKCNRSGVGSAQEHSR